MGQYKAPFLLYDRRTEAEGFHQDGHLTEDTYSIDRTGGASGNPRDNMIKGHIFSYSGYDNTTCACVDLTHRICQLPLNLKIDSSFGTTRVFRNFQ